MAGGGVVASGDNVRATLYKGKATVYVVLVALLAGSGGLLFGYDIGVTGGVSSFPEFQQNFFPEAFSHRTDPGTSPFCKYNDHILQLFTSSLFLACAVSSLIGMVTSNKYGRKLTMMLGAIGFLAGTALMAAATTTAQVVLGRVVLGLGVGFANQATPLYLSEMAPFHLRGALNIAFQMAVTIGIFAAQAINLGTTGLTYGWRISLALGAVPAIILFIGTLIMPETPNSLIERGRHDEGRRVLAKLRGTEEVDAEYDDICDAVNVAKSIQNPYRTITRRRYLPQLVMTIAIPIFQQFTGINAIMFYAPQLFESLGSGSNVALLNTVVIGAVNVAATVVAIVCVDRLGRKVLFIQGGIQMIICEVVVGSLIYVRTFQYTNSSINSAILAFICIYVCGFAWSWGPLGWLVPAEIQPLETRSAGTAINTSVNFVMSFIIGQCFLSMLCSMEFGIFYFFAGMVTLMTLFVMLFVPETRNVPIEEMEEVRIGQHWFWRRVVAGASRGSGAYGGDVHKAEQLPA